MSDVALFERFLYELRTLLTALENHTISIGAGSPPDRRAHALREMARLGAATAALAETFEADDLAALAGALAIAAERAAPSQASERDAVTGEQVAPERADAPLPPLGARDALTFMRWRVDQFADAGRVAPPDEHAAALADDLERVLRRARHTGGASAGGFGASGVFSAFGAGALGDEGLGGAFSDAAPLTEEEKALIRSFPTAVLRPRPDDAPATAQAPVEEPQRVEGRPELAPTEPDTPSLEAPAFLARTESGGVVPVFGGAQVDIDEIPPEMRRLFAPELESDLRALGQLMVEFERRPGDSATVSNMAFIAHKVKGGAATIGFNGIAAIAIHFEAALKLIQRRAIPRDTSLIAALAAFLDLFIRALEPTAALEEPSPQIIEEASALRATLETQAAASDANPTGDASAPNTIAPTTALPSGAAPLGSASGEGGLGDKLDGEPDTARRAAGERALALRVETRQLDALMNQLGALAVNRGALTRNRGATERVLAEMEGALRRLREKSAHLADQHPLTYHNLRQRDARTGAAWRPLPTSYAPAGGAAPAGGPPTLPVAMLSGGVGGAISSVSGALRDSWDALELAQFSEVDTALRGLTEVVADVETFYGALTGALLRLSQLTEAQEALTRDIEREVMRMRLAPLTELTPRLRMTTAVLANNLNKRVHLRVEGEMTEIDRSVLEALSEPLIQLARNAIIHGLESPEERVEAGKSETCSLWLHAYYSGAEVVIEVGDDGRGVNPMALTAAALSLRMLTPEEADALTHEQALALMFRLGVSTAGAPGVMAGSGVGLAEVAEAIHALRGDIQVESDQGRGSIFRIRVPISLSTLPTLQVRAGGQVFALPFALVGETTIVHPDHLRPTNGERAADEARAGEWLLSLEAPTPPSAPPDADDEEARGPRTVEQPEQVEHIEIPAYSLAESLGFAPLEGDRGMAVVVERRGRRVALLVESVGEAREMAVRSLPAHLRRRAVRGAIVRPEDGEVALLIDPHELLTQRLAGGELMVRPAMPAPAPRPPAPRTLIVDDSVTIRRALEQMLTAAGFETAQARDGYEALEMIEREPPRVVILDVEMPRLSGFELLTLMRSSPQYAPVRVVMLTSRAADRHREYALALGADAYLVKPCPQETLIATIRRLLDSDDAGAESAELTEPTDLPEYS